jgi:hypothetical protein
VKGVASWLRERPLLSITLCLALLFLASGARWAIGGILGLILWMILFVPAVFVAATLLRVLWERRER